MSDAKPFYIRDPWVFDPEKKQTTPGDPSRGFATRCLHAGFDPRQSMEHFRSFVPPIVPSMTYPYTRPDEVPCPVYGRTRTPTNTVLEERLAAMEGGEACLTAGSGSQALFQLIFTLARPGDNVVTSLNIFGEGYKQAASIFPERCRVQFRFVADPGNPAEWASLIDSKTRLVWVETPSNPCLFVTDIEAVVEVAHSRGVPLLVDNTTATSALQQPMKLGADIVLLSLTKFMAGNATVIGGALIGPEGLIEDIRWNTTEFVGSIMPPFEAWLTLQYLETLSLRMRAHCENAQQVADFLHSHSKVKRVNYPGLESHTQIKLAQKQMAGGGGLLSFVIQGGKPGAIRLMDRFELIVQAVTFGTSRSICMHPATITHEHLTREEREQAGIDDGLIRFSVGLEEPEDIIKDLEQALAGV
ncbi:MAG: aminotransferase class I/II-fold pyridoxal phosphate-dependent enzyme [Desulfohalobiaceae bacterium]|nr:aminotransferase class I/II-fold pyridoxal phosphate-dependent enzyme [Desulfohalobiaceae bacterium]